MPRRPAPFLARAICFTLLASLLAASLASAHPTAPAFEDIRAGLPGVQASSVAWGDYDNDGDLDLVLTGDTGAGYVSRVYRNTGGSFADINAGLPGVFIGSVAWGDYDNDGDLDLVLMGATSTGYVSRVYRNNGSSFTDINAGLPGVYGGSVAWGDYDNDGDLDLVLTGDTGSVYISRVYRNTGGSFAAIGAGLVAVAASSVAWGDYDNDGDLDLALTGDSNAGTSPYVSRVYQNTGVGFLDINAGLLGVSLGSVAWGDYDYDGDLDLLITGESTTSVGAISRVYQNTGGSFADINAGLPGLSVGMAAWGDYDNDGDLDLVLTGNTPITSGYISRVYRNTAGSFTDINAGLPGVATGAVAWGDYDNDRDLDLVLMGNSGSPTYLTRVYQNNTSPANTPPTAPDGLSVTFGASAATFRWSASIDDQTRAEGLSYNLRIGGMPGGAEILSPMADLSTGYRSVVRLGNVNQNLQWSVPLGALPSSFYWSVQAVDPTFAGSLFAPEQFASNLTGVDPAFRPAPELSAWPNPFRDNVRLGFELPAAMSVRLDVFDLRGRRVRSVAPVAYGPGPHTMTWAGRGDDGARQVEGIYFMRLRGPGLSVTRRVVRLK